MNIAYKLPITPKIDAAESERRRRSIDFARGSVRFEGVSLTPEMEEVNARFIAGELNEEEYEAAILPLCRAA